VGTDATVRLGAPESRVDPATTSSVQPDGQSSGWVLTDSEEFAGTMSVEDSTAGLVKFRSDGPLWRTWYPEWQMFFDDSAAGPHSNTNYEAYYVTSKVSLGSGALRLACDRQTTLSGWDYTAGMITTIPSQRTFLYGFFEVRARITGGGTGNWPAFWTTSATTNTWNSEIDMWESFNSTFYKTNVYVDSNGGSNGDGLWTENSITFDQSAYHTYGCRWTPSGTTFYRDGVQTFTTAQRPTEAHYLLLNNGAQSSAVFSSSLVEFDYVRVWSAA
jgi:hypothetical protein